MAAISIGLGTMIAGMAAGGAEVYGAAKQGGANKKALTFEREQADFAAKNAEADRRANYDQWAARQHRINALTGGMGLGTQEIPAYVPGITPHFAPRSVGDYVSGPQPVAPRPPAPGIAARQPGQPATGTPNPYRVGDVNSYL